MNPALMPLTAFKRPALRGRTDKFSPAINPSDMSQQDLIEVLQAVSPEDVGGSVLSDDYVSRSITRLTQYTRFWRFYRGHHFDVTHDDGMEKVVTNWCKAIADKRTSWATGRRFSLMPSKGNELVAEALERMWIANGKNVLLREVARTAHVTGDSFMYVTARTKDLKGAKLPLDQRSVRITALNPSYVFPVWKENEPGEMAACYLHFPIWNSTTTRYSAFTAFISPEKVVYYVDGEQKSSRPNPLGMVNVVHVPAEPYGGNTFGSSILEPLIPLNLSYNETRHSIKRIIRYHGEPTTLVFGMRFASMERGANRLWSNLPNPKEADVRNLEMQGDLAQFDLDLKETKEMLYVLGKTPRIAFNSDGAHISNTSGMALALLFQPLVEASNEAQELLSVSISKVNQIAAAIHENVFKEDLRALADHPEAFLDNEVVFESLLPKDEQQAMDIATKKIEMGIWSKAEAARRLSGVHNSELLALELAADANAKLAVKAEEYKANQGLPVNFNATMLDSVFLHEDLVALASKLPAAKTPTPKQEPVAP